MWRLRNKAADGRTKKYLFEMPAESLPTRLASVKRWVSIAKTMATKMLDVFFCIFFGHATKEYDGGRDQNPAILIENL